MTTDYSVRIGALARNRIGSGDSRTKAASASPSDARTPRRLPIDEWGRLVDPFVLGV